METLDYWLEPDLVIALRHDVERHAEKILRLRKTLEELASLRSAVEVRQIGPPRSFDVYAVDSSYGSPPLELVGGVFTVVAYGYVGVSGGVQDRFLTGALYFADSREGDVSRYAALLEKRLAARLLAGKLRGEKRFDLLVLDGEVAIHPLPFNLAVRGGRLEEVNKAVDRLLSYAARSGASIVAVAKRVRSRYLSLLAGRCLPVNDKVAASAMLRPGEYFSLGKLRDLLPRWVSIHYADCEGGPEREAILKCYRGERVSLSPRGERLCRRLVEFGQNFNAVLTTSTYPHLRLLGDVEVVYYMPPGHRTAVRVEVLDTGGLGVGEIVSYLASTTSTVTGYPQILDAVDQYVRVSPDLVEAVLTALLSKTPESLTHLMWPTNMQKRLASRY
ncbi:DNA double-strand break repair nuclease NurA [Pyrobaculum sp. 3827-6]|uniref:DNA double-strand break repair nuclease NurA n=1 Tax=Pyrobaculum sp. 3827-6 TaxID=2983604 RepID=UPI0021D8A81A|nr:DNA double-strand break repair nuclease NurA [Pyrobaculum sp. 3827-6]MCU7786435.1 DNA double-strand break repair nuclease NurA [Pyrobaculum sp. 3827-6]